MSVCDASTNPVRPPSRPLCVLVAEDVEEIRGLIGIWLRAAGHRVRLVGNGRDGVGEVNRVALDLVIADVLMPEADGLGLIREVRSKQPAARIVAISGGGRAMSAATCIDQAREFGAHATLLKPFNAAQLRAAIAAALA